jgi:hypothetical protein
MLISGTMQDCALGKWDRHVTTFMKDVFWNSLKERLTTLETSPGLDFVYYDASLTVQNKKRNRFVKIATSGEVQVDVRLRNGEFKSQYFSLNTVCATVECFASQVQKQFPALAVI